MEVMPHLKLRDDLGIQYAILPGDPARVERIAEQLEDVEELEFNREYKSIAGTYKGIRVLAVSTGIGGPSTGIRSGSAPPASAPERIGAGKGPVYGQSRRQLCHTAFQRCEGADGPRPKADHGADSVSSGPLDLPDRRGGRFEKRCGERQL